MVGLLLAVIYLSFISLGLPDSLLGSGWPVMYQQLQVPVSYAGIISMTIAAGTILSSLLSDRLTLKYGAGKITAVSVATTAAALFGFSFSSAFWMLILWAVPYGLGAGAVDAALNNYVALHFKSKHMSWLHCMWGVGVTISPYVMSYALTHSTWNMGYRYIGILQVCLTAVLFLSLPLWKKRAGEVPDQGRGSEEQRKPLSIPEILAIPGAKEILVAFFCYSAVEQTTGLWSATYLTRYWQMDPAEAASLASLFYLGITIGRGFNGFLAMKFSDTQLIRLGLGIIFGGVALLFLPWTVVTAKIGLILIGLGCAPIYPCIIHSTPGHFGADRSQALVGVQMAFAYIGTLAVPPLFGLLGNHFGMSLLPWYVGFFAVLMFAMHERLVKVTA